MKVKLNANPFDLHDVFEKPPNVNPGGSFISYLDSTKIGEKIHDSSLILSGLPRGNSFSAFLSDFLHFLDF